MRERFLVVRDEQLGAGDTTGAITATTTQVQPSWNLSLNYVEIPYPNYPPASIRMTAGTQEFWRVANASADTILDLEHHDRRVFLAEATSLAGLWPTRRVLVVTGFFLLLLAVPYLRDAAIFIRDVLTLTIGPVSTALTELLFAPLLIAAGIWG